MHNGLASLSSDDNVGPSDRSFGPTCQQLFTRRSSRSATSAQPGRRDHSPCPIDSLTAADRHSVAFAQMPMPPFWRRNTMLLTSGTWNIKSQSNPVKIRLVSGLYGEGPAVSQYKDQQNCDEKSKQRCDISWSI